MVYPCVIGSVQHLCINVECIEQHANVLARKLISMSLPFWMRMSATLEQVNVCLCSSPALDEGAAQNPQGGPMWLLPHVLESPSQKALQDPPR